MLRPYTLRGHKVDSCVSLAPRPTAGHQTLDLGMVVRIHRGQSQWSSPPPAMMTYVALLRGINVGGHKPVAMAELRDLLARLGFVDARSLLQSGNLGFRGEARTGGRPGRIVGAQGKQRLGLGNRFFFRPAQGG